MLTNSIMIDGATDAPGDAPRNPAMVPLAPVIDSVPNVSTLECAMQVPGRLRLDQLSPLTDCIGYQCA